MCTGSQMLILFRGALESRNGRIVYLSSRSWCTNQPCTGNEFVGGKNVYKIILPAAKIDFQNEICDLPSGL
jgi:hypothetical protein